MNHQPGTHSLFKMPKLYMCTNGKQQNNSSICGKVNLCGKLAVFQQKLMNGQFNRV